MARANFLGDSGRELEEEGSGGVSFSMLEPGSISSRGKYGMNV